MPFTSQTIRCRQLGFLAASLWAAATTNIVADIPPGQAGFQSKVQPFLKDHCFRCHGADKDKGGLTLHEIKGVGGSDEEMTLWEDILIMIEDGDMPPDDEPQPNAKERDAVTAWIEQSIKDAAQKAKQQAAKDGGAGKDKALARRLTNIEYQNTVNDLLGLEIDLIKNLPEDPVKHYRFNNSAKFMRLGPEQIDRYLENARKALASAIVEGERPEVIKKRQAWPSDPAPDAKDRKGEFLKKNIPRSHIGVHGNGRNTAAAGVNLTKFPKQGPFKVSFQASAVLKKGATEVPLHWVMGQGIQENTSTRLIKPLGTTILTSEKPQVFEFTGNIENYPALRGRSNKGRKLPDTISITPINIYDDGTVKNDTSFFKTTNASFPQARVDWVEFEGPVYETWPPESHKRILFASPLRKSNPDAYVKEVLTQFMTRAYRRPATENEVERFFKIYQLVEPEMPSFEAAMRETLAMVLISPQFLIHTVPKKGITNNEYALASRLSYFLWATMPDDELLSLAANGKLSNPNTLRKQVERMIDDERFGDFIHNFTMQWMNIDKTLTVPINRKRFPNFLYDISHGSRKGTEVPYRPTIRDHMIEETVGYIRECFKHNSTVTKLVDSDVAYLNQPLAVHYGVEGVKTHEHQLVKLKPDHNLGGLLTHGSVLIGNGTGTVPHPIYRAVWLREAILGEKVAEPPSGIPDVSESAEGEDLEKALTIKDILKKHRDKRTGACYDCHARLDPWGIPFEHYNAVGQYQPKVPKKGLKVKTFNIGKSKEPQEFKDMQGYLNYLAKINTEPLDATAKLPNGPVVNNMKELKVYILENKVDDVANNVARRLLTYGLGRKLDFKDRPAIDALLAESEKNQYKLRDMLTAICTSELFRQ